MATSIQLNDQVKKTLQVEVNPTTGNIFYTIADHETLAMHMRIWKDVANKMETAIGFRVRLTKNPAGPAILNLQEHIMGLFPGVPWMGKSSSHMSIAGFFKVALSQYEGVAIMEQLEKDGTYKKIWDHLQKTFPTFEYKLNEEQFIEFMKEVIAEELGIGKPHQGPTASVFSFGEAKAAKNEAQTNQDPEPTLPPMTNASDDPAASAKQDSHVLPGGGLLGKLKQKANKKDTTEDNSALNYLAQAEAKLAGVLENATADFGIEIEGTEKTWTADTHGAQINEWLVHREYGPFIDLEAFMEYIGEGHMLAEEPMGDLQEYCFNEFISQSEAYSDAKTAGFGTETSGMNEEGYPTFTIDPALFLLDLENTFGKQV